MKGKVKGDNIFQEVEETSAFLSQKNPLSRALFSLENKTISYDELDTLNDGLFLSSGWGLVKYNTVNNAKVTRPVFIINWDGFRSDTELRAKKNRKGDTVFFGTWHEVECCKSPYIKFLLEFSTMSEELFSIAVANPGMPFAFSIDYKKYIDACGCDAYHSRFYTRKMLELKKKIDAHNKKQSMWYNPEAEKVFNKLKESK